MERNEEEKINDLLKYLATPKDWNVIEPNERASILVLSFIGYIARPINIPKDILEKAIEAFNNNRGKVEWEIEAVQKVLKEDFRWRYVCAGCNWIYKSQTRSIWLANTKCKKCGDIIREVNN